MGKTIKEILQTVMLVAIALLISFSVSAVDENCNHVYTPTITKPATCTDEGITTYTCVCGDSYTEIIPVTGHNWDTWSDFPMPTCTEEGARIRLCKECMVEDRVVVPATGHYFEKEVEPATETSDGKYFSRCANCFTIEQGEEEIIPRIAVIKLSTEECTYNGKVRNPSVIVEDSQGKKLVEGTDFVRIYGGFDGSTAKEKKNPGRYIIAIKFQGNYEGEKNLIFIIKPKAPTGLKALSYDSKSLLIEWNESTGATGYRVYQYSPSKEKYVLKKSIKGTIYNATGLKAGTSYKFKIRPYTKTEDGTVIWGEDSKVCTAKTKTLYGVTLSGSSATLYIGATKQLKATTTPSDKSVTWKSSKTSVATVSSSGKVTAKKAGTATITVTFKYKDKTYTDTYKITVKTPTISLNKTSVSIFKGKTTNLEATTAPDDMNVTWKSSDTSVATVSSLGKVTAKKAGTATITASFTYKGTTYKKTCKVTVKTTKETNITDLIKYIKKYGKENPYGYKFIIKEVYQEGSTFSFCIFYDHVADELNFVTYVEPDDLGALIDFSIEMGRDATSARAEAEICYGYYWDDYYMRATTKYSFKPADYKNEYSLFEYWDENDFPEEMNDMTSNLLYSTVGTSMLFWDGMVKDAIGVGLDGVGFTNYKAE